MTLTTNAAAAATMPQGLKYSDRVDWIAKRDMLRRVASAAPVVVASADEVALREVENQCGVDYFDKLDSAADAPKPIWIHTTTEAAFAVACIKRRKQARRAA